MAEQWSGRGAVGTGLHPESKHSGSCTHLRWSPAPCLRPQHMKHEVAGAPLASPPLALPRCAAGGPPRIFLPSFLPPSLPSQKVPPGQAGQWVSPLRFASAKKPRKQQNSRDYNPQQKMASQKAERSVMDLGKFIINGRSDGTC